MFLPFSFLTPGTCSSLVLYFQTVSPLPGVRKGPILLLSPMRRRCGASCPGITALACCLQEGWGWFWCLLDWGWEVGLYSSPEAAPAVMVIRACSGDCLFLHSPNSGHGAAEKAFHAALVVQCSSSWSLGFSFCEVLCSFQARLCFHQTQGHLFGRSTGGGCPLEQAQARCTPKLARRLCLWLFLQQQHEHSWWVSWLLLLHLSC